MNDFRNDFAGIGTNKAKRRLNKLALTDPIAKAVRLALEIEDKEISANSSYGEYQQRIYESRTKLIYELSDFCKENGWKYGVKTEYIFFDIPSCEQISWYLLKPTKEEELEKYNKLPEYIGDIILHDNADNVSVIEKSTINLIKDV